jgi:uncharacterized protein YbjT (DUF2867 family)
MIVVAGGTGTLGRSLIPLLTGEGLPVRVVTRDVNTAARVLPGVDAVAADVTRPDDARRAVAGADVVVSAITGFASPAGVEAVDAAGNRVLADVCRAARIRHFVLLSVMGAAADHPLALFRAKFAAEEAVRRSGVSATIIRPSPYLETWLGLVGSPLVSSGKTVVFGRGRNPINFVSALDVARFVELAICDPALVGQTIDVPGPENLTLEDLVAITRTASGSSGAVSHAPRAVLRFLSVALRPIQPMRAGQVATALAMDTHDMAVDGESVRSRFPTIPMTTAATVASTLFGRQGAEVDRPQPA